MGKPNKLEALQLELGKVAPRPGERILAPAIGRAILSPLVDQAVEVLSIAQPGKLEVKAFRAARLDYFPPKWVAKLMLNGMSKANPRLMVPAASELPERIYRPGDFIQAIYECRRLDGASVRAPLQAPFAKVRLEQIQGQKRFGLDVGVWDVPNGFYKGGFTIHGEKVILGSLANSRHREMDTQTQSRVPIHYVRVANVQINDEAFMPVKHRVVDGLQNFMQGSMLDLSPIEAFRPY